MYTVKQSRRSAAELEDAILVAADRLLRERGFEGMNMHDVALAARVSKASLYQRWPSKSELVISVLDRLSPEAIELPSTGDVWHDLQQIVTDLVAMSDRIRGVAVAVISAASYDPDLAVAFHSLIRRRQDAELELIDRAIAEGHIPAGINRQLVVDVLVSVIWFRILISGERIEPEFPDEVVRLLRAAATGNVPVPPVAKASGRRKSYAGERKSGPRRRDGR